MKTQMQIFFHGHSTPQKSFSLKPYSLFRLSQFYRRNDNPQKIHTDDLQRIVKVKVRENENFFSYCHLLFDNYPLTNT